VIRDRPGCLGVLKGAQRGDRGLVRRLIDDAQITPMEIDLLYAPLG